MAILKLEIRTDGHESHYIIEAIEGDTPDRHAGTYVKHTKEEVCALLEKLMPIQEIGR